MDSVSNQEASPNTLSSSDDATASTKCTAATLIGARSAHGSGNSDLGHPLETFTCFPKLPLELRLKVWNNFMPGPRVIEIRFNKRERRFVTDTKVPTILQICPESRSEALKTYQILKQAHKIYDSEQALLHQSMFEADLCQRRLAGVDVSDEVFQPYITPALQTYIDYAKDTLYMLSDRCELPLPYSSRYLYGDGGGMSTLLADLANADGGCQIQHLAFDLEYTRSYAGEIVSEGPRGILEKLISITVVCRDPSFNEWYYSNGKFVRAALIDSFEILGGDETYDKFKKEYMADLLREVDNYDGSEGDELDFAGQERIREQLKKIEIIPAEIVRQEEAVPMRLHD